MTALAMKTTPMMVALVERVIEKRERLHRETAWLMSHDGPNSGRGQVTRAPSSVNATEVRGSDRWHSSKSTTGECLAVVAPAWLIAAFGSAVAFDILRGSARPVAVATERASKPRRATAKASTRADADIALMSAMGTLHDPAA